MKMKIRNATVSALLLAFALAAGGCGGTARQESAAGTENAAETENAAGTENAAETGNGTDTGSAAEAENGTEAENAANKGNSAESAETPETAPTEDLHLDGLTPVYADSLKDGVYPISVDSSSPMFRIEACELTVADGAMSAVMTMSGTGYLKLYMGSADKAQAAGESEFIPYVETADGAHTYQVPVEALDMGITCSAFSKKRESWYERTLVFRSSSLPQDAFADGAAVTAESLGLEDGLYTVEVSLGGGSGRASVESPALLKVENGKAIATIVWGSANYDYMKVNGEKLEALSMEEHSVFEIPVGAFDRSLPVIADTVAMSTPHEVEYTLYFDSSTIQKSDGGDSPAAAALRTENRAEVPADSGAVAGAVSASVSDSVADPGLRPGMSPVRSLDLKYADRFRIDWYEDGCALISISDSGNYLVVPEKTPVPENLAEGITVIRQPVKNIYLTATSAMDLFRGLDSVGSIRLSGTDADGWYIEEARQALRDGSMLYAGKYNAPDYERILSENCGLAVESTMIGHSPEVKEQLERLGIPVLIERSSYEDHPLGRMEWIKLYGVLLGKEGLAREVFDREVSRIEPLLRKPQTGKTVAFFHIASNGAVTVRRSGDYVSKMIGLAGGVCLPADLPGSSSSLSTMNMQMEAFYAAARDADVIVYNSTIGGELRSLSELLEKSSLLSDFKAVKEGQVWCTEKNMFQETLGIGGMIEDIHRILTEDDPRDLNYIYRLRS